MLVCLSSLLCVRFSLLLLLPLLSQRVPYHYSISSDFPPYHAAQPIFLPLLPRPQVRGVIVENTFISVSHMVDQLLPLLTSIKWLVLRLKWNNEEKARRLTRPVLYISGELAAFAEFARRLVVRLLRR